MAVHAQIRHHLLIFLNIPNAFISIKSPSSKLSNAILSVYFPLFSLGWIGIFFYNYLSFDRLSQRAWYMHSVLLMALVV